MDIDESQFPASQLLNVNNKNNFGEDGQMKADTNTKVLMLFSVILSVCVLINTRIIYVMIVNINRSNKYVNMLVAHYSTIIFLYCDAFLVRTFEKQFVNLFPMAGMGFCESLTFFQNMLSGAFPLNAVALTYERMRAADKPFQKLYLIQCVCGIWLFAVILNVPSIFMVKYVKNSITKFEHCKEKLLLKSHDVTLAYEWTRFFVFYPAVCLYMADVIYRTWGKIRCAHVPQGNRFRNWKLWPKRMQFVFIHSALFLLIWLPIGTTEFEYKVFQLVEEEEKTQQSSFLVLLETCSTFVLLIVCPFMYVLLNENVGPFSLLARNVLKIMCRENPPTVEDIPTGRVDEPGKTGDEYRGKL